MICFCSSVINSEILLHLRLTLHSLIIDDDPDRALLSLLWKKIVFDSRGQAFFGAFGTIGRDFPILSGTASLLDSKLLLLFDSASSPGGGLLFTAIFVTFLGLSASHDLRDQSKEWTHTIELVSKEADSILELEFSDNKYSFLMSISCLTVFSTPTVSFCTRAFRLFSWMPTGCCCALVAFGQISRKQLRLR